MKKIKYPELPLKVLLFDIETSPNLAYVWGKYEQNVISFKKEWELLSVAWKWFDLKGAPIHCAARNNLTEKEIVLKLWTLFDNADVIIAHNGDQFDVKKVKAKFLEYGLKPPSSYKTVDTKKIAKNQFMLNSNSLDDIGNLLKIGRKKQTGGFELWLKCMAGDKKAWKKMIAYNKQDVALLEKVYLKVRPWLPNHPDVYSVVGRNKVCPTCGSKKLNLRGFRYTKTGRTQKLNCLDCGSWTQGPHIKD